MPHRIRHLPAAAGTAAVLLASLAWQAVGPQPGASAAPVAHRAMGTVHVAMLSVGDVLVDAAGRTLYVFSPDKRHAPTCTGPCTAAWPPLLVRHVQAGNGARKRLLGSVKTKDGRRQATYDGWPLYTFSGDSKAGQANGQGLKGFGGTWSTIGAAGHPDFGKTAASTSASGSGASGGGW
jgi:predicted lipoprotein with Yx(FWY)xxD motif